MSSAREHTITGADWARELPRARARRAPEAVAARRYAGPTCPVCGQGGLQRDMTGGTEIIHDAHTRCWWPAGTLLDQGRVAA